MWETFSNGNSSLSKCIVYLMSRKSGEPCRALSWEKISPLTFQTLSNQNFAEYQRFNLGFGFVIGQQIRRL